MTIAPARSAGDAAAPYCSGYQAALQKWQNGLDQSLLGGG